MDRHDLTSLFNELLDDWERYRSSPAAHAAVAGWRKIEPQLEAIATPEAAVTAIRDASDMDCRDAKTLAILRLARTDLDARRVLLQAFWPGLLHLTTVYGRPWDYEDTAATVVMLALERIAGYPLHRRSRVAANIIRDVQNGLHRMRTREQHAAALRGLAVPIDDALHLPADETRSAAEEVIDLIGEAIRTQRLTESEARLIVLRRLLDTPTAVTAAEQGRRPSSIRKARERAEARLARTATVEVACA